MYKPDKVWNRFAKRYEKSPVSNEEAYQKKLEITRSYFTPESEVLELGCGTGTTAVAHAPFVKQILAIDVSSKMLEFAENKAKAAGVTNVIFSRANIENISDFETTYDVIMCHSILHLLEDKQAVIANVFQLLKPGGVFVSSTVCIGSNNAFLRALLMAGRRIGLLPLVRFFSVEELAESITDAGFSIDSQWLPEKSDAVFIVAMK
ncbi:SAM-dependent methyltransferase [Rhodobacterales bacterium 52_120_T64]|nr:SAM-dependent methyltransferase [Rhodobacterales bacterium 52_120_T64]